MSLPTQEIGPLVPDDSRAGRLLADGDLTMTVTSKTSGEHVTIRYQAKIKRSDHWAKRPLAEADYVFARTEAGRIGTYNVERGTFKPAPDADQRQVWAAIAGLLAACGHVHEGVRFQEAVPCGRCGELLTDPESIDRGYGPYCYGEVTKSRAMRAERAS